MGMGRRPLGGKVGPELKKPNFRDFTCLHFGSINDLGPVHQDAVATETDVF